MFLRLFVVSFLTNHQFDSAMSFGFRSRNALISLIYKKVKYKTSFHRRVILIKSFKNDKCDLKEFEAFKRFASEGQQR